MSALIPSSYNLAPRSQLDVSGLVSAEKPQMALEELQKFLEDTYCGTMSVEFDAVEVSEGNKRAMGGRARRGVLRKLLSGSKPFACGLCPSCLWEQKGCQLLLLIAFRGE